MGTRKLATNRTPVYIMSSKRSYTHHEAAIHKASVAYLAEKYPGTITYRHDGGDQVGHAKGNIIAREGGRCKGAPDLYIVLKGADGSGGLAVEFKSEAGRVSKDQRDAHQRMRTQGINVNVVRSVEEFECVLHEHVYGSNPLLHKAVYGSPLDADVDSGSVLDKGPGLDNPSSWEGGHSFSQAAFLSPGSTGDSLSSLPSTASQCPSSAASAASAAASGGLLHRGSASPFLDARGLEYLSTARRTHELELRWEEAERRRHLFESAAGGDSKA